MTDGFPLPQTHCHRSSSAPGTRARQRVHLDTDFGGDPDDACALALLLGSDDVEVTGVTTNLDVGGERAGCVAHYLQLAGRADVAVVAGADASLTTRRTYASTFGDVRY